MFITAAETRESRCLPEDPCGVLCCYQLERWVFLLSFFHEKVYHVKMSYAACRLQIGM